MLPVQLVKKGRHCSKNKGKRSGFFCSPAAVKSEAVQYYSLDGNRIGDIAH